MGSKTRERAYERRRHTKHMARLAKAQQRRRRTQVVALIAVGALAVGGTVTGLLLGDGLLPSDPSTQAGDTAASDVTPTTGTAPDPALAEGRTWTGTMALSAGTLGIELDGAAAPQAVASFTQLAAAGFFDGLTCHRLSTAITILQCGDPYGDGTGGPGYAFGPVENAPADDVYPAGTIAMARVSGDPFSMGSQFFIVYADTSIPSDVAGGYTVFGQVTSGLDVVQRIADAGTRSGSEAPAETVTIEKVEIQ
ncbi:MAG: peptidylprolyl isomerase [Micrococcales bacterium]|nr:peptidylprolyl isomerase [Micrococcales bacterium]